MSAAASEPSPSSRVPAGAFLAAATLGFAACLLVTSTELRSYGAPPFALVGVWVLAALVVKSPLRGSLVLFAALPLFGNHPGGRFMELLDLSVAAAVLGLAWRALRSGRAAPSGTLWRAAGLVLLSATVALVPALPEIAVWAARIDDFRSLLAQTLTASETIPLYSLGSWFQLLLAAAWAYALVWSGADRDFAASALRAVALGLFVVMFLGALDFHHLIDLRRDLLVRVDPNVDFLDRFQSIFWNPGWFAWYFAIALGMSLGQLWLTEGPRRGVVALCLTVCYLYFLANPQRGGLIAVHAVLIALLLLGRRALRRISRRWLIAAGVVAALGLVVVAAYGVAWPERWLVGFDRLLSPQRDVNRRNLWICAIQMWRTSPLLGIGEGTFGWRYRDFVPAGSSLDVGLWGDAHSTWLQILAARGLAGLLAYLALLVRLGGRIRMALGMAGRERGIGVGLALASVAFVTYSFVQHLFYLQSIQVLFWGIVALAEIATARQGESIETRGRTRVVAILAVIALALQARAAGPLAHAAVLRIASEPHGFYPLERGDRRWSSRRGTLCIYPTAPLMSLDVGTMDPTATAEPVLVTLSSAGRVLDRFPLKRGTVTRTILLPGQPGLQAPVQTIPFGECRAGTGWTPLTVEVSRLWSPKVRGSLDGRLFGVSVHAPEFHTAR